MLPGKMEPRLAVRLTEETVGEGESFKEADAGMVWA